MVILKNLFEDRINIFIVISLLLASIGLFLLLYFYANIYVFYIYLFGTYSVTSLFIFIGLALPSHGEKLSFKDKFLITVLALASPITVPFISSLEYIKDRKSLKERYNLPKQKITGFHLETNQVFGWIDRFDKLVLSLAVLYKEGYNLTKIMEDDTFENKEGSKNFGSRKEHKGDLSLIEWLTKNKEIDLIVLNDKLKLLIDNFSKTELKEKLFYVMKKA